MTSVDLPEDREERRKLMAERWGTPQRIHAGDPLRDLGIRDQVHPSDVLAFVYSSVAAFNAYSEANRKFNDFPFPTFGPLIMAADKVIGVIDLRLKLSVLTDPKLSDDTESASVTAQKRT